MLQAVKDKAAKERAFQEQMGQAAYDQAQSDNSRIGHGPPLGPSGGYSTGIIQPSPEQQGMQQQAAQRAVADMRGRDYLARNPGQRRFLKQYIDDRSPLMAELTNNTPMALPAYRVKKRDEITKEDLENMPNEQREIETKRNTELKRFDDYVAKAADREKKVVGDPFVSVALGNEKGGGYDRLMDRERKEMGERAGRADRTKSQVHSMHDAERAGEEELLRHPEKAGAFGLTPQMMNELYQAGGPGLLSRALEVGGHVQGNEALAKQPAWQAEYGRHQMEMEQKMKQAEMARQILASKANPDGSPLTPQQTARLQQIVLDGSGITGYPPTGPLPPGPLTGAGSPMPAQQPVYNAPRTGSMNGLPF